MDEDRVNQESSPRRSRSRSGSQKPALSPRKDEDMRSASASPSRNEVDE